VPKRTFFILASLSLLAAAVAACAGSGAVRFPNLDGFRSDGGRTGVGLHFPTGMAVDSSYRLSPPDGGLPRARYLYLVADSNFDLVYDRGVVAALDLDRYGPPETGLVPPSMVADGGGWDGQPLRFPDFTEVGSVNVDTGWVYTDSQGGQLRLARTSTGAERLLLGSRFSNVITGIDVNGGSLGCFGQPGRDCMNPTSAPPLQLGASSGDFQILDVFGLSEPISLIQDGGSGPPEVLVTHLRTQPHATIFGTNSNYGNNTIASSAFVIRQSIDDLGCRTAEGIGMFPASEIVALPAEGTLFGIFTGRFDGLGPNGVSFLTLGPGTCASGSSATSVGYADAGTTTVDLSAQMKGFDGRGLAVSSQADKLYVLTRAPDALVVMGIDRSVAGQLGLRAESITSLPSGPSEILSLPRLGLADLVVVSCPDSGLIAFYDDQLGQVTATLSGVGDLPFAMAAAPRTIGINSPVGGVRLFVVAFGSGQIAVIDLPEPSNARSARVIALLGSPEDTTPQLINTSGQLQLPYGPTSTGIP
jgi:hypothetical protein